MDITNKREKEQKFGPQTRNLVTCTRYHLLERIIPSSFYKKLESWGGSTLTSRKPLKKEEGQDAQN